jgi:hypothetical protein
MRGNIMEDRSKHPGKESKTSKSKVGNPKERMASLKAQATLTDDEHNIIGYFSETVAQNCEKST